jgi:hypothetical protein
VSDNTRREFFKRVFSLGIPIALGGWLADKVGGELVKRTVDVAIPKPTALADALVSSSKSLLFGSGADYKVIPSIKNPYKLWGFDGPMSSATTDAMASLNQLLYVPLERITVTSGLTAKDLTGNLLILGSPVANVTAAAVMGRNGSSFLFEKRSDGAVLKFPFYLDVDASEEEFQSGAHRSRGSWDKAPVWQLKGRGNALIAPRIKDGQPIEDRILISSMPNFLNRGAFEAGHRLTIFSGAHGVGTRALQLVIRDERMIQELIAYSKGKSAWQAIIVVDRVSPDGKTPLSLGGIEDMTPVDANFERLARLSQAR